MNAEKIYAADLFLKSLTLNGLAYPDGIGAVFALRRKGLKECVRIPGSELWLDIIKKAEGEKSIFIIGSTQEVLDLTIKKLKLEYPRLEIKGFINGFIKTSELQDLEDSIIKTKPDIVFVAQGSPKQELLMERLYKQHEAIYMGLGGSFDVYTGYVKRAPRQFRANGLEWLYRLISQPSRIKRQRVLLPFTIKLLLGKY